MKLFTSVNTVADLCADTPVVELAAPFASKEEVWAALSKADILLLNAAELPALNETLFGEPPVAGRAILMLYVFFQNLKAIVQVEMSGGVCWYNTANGAYTRCGEEEAARFKAL